MANTFKINDIDYDCEFILTNPDDQKITFTKSAFRGMVIDDEIFNPFTAGTVSIANPFDTMEDDYFFRGDGRDELQIKFQPTDNEEVDAFDMTFIVIDSEDHVNPNVRSENIKTLSLIEVNALPFLEKIPYGKKYTGLVGDLIKEIIVELLGEELVDDEDWTSGDFFIEYTPPLSFRYIDLLYYLLQHFYTKEGSLNVKSLLMFDASSAKYKFQAITKIFEKNKDLTNEAFSLTQIIPTEGAGTDNVNNPPDNNPTELFTGQLRNLGYSTPFHTINNNNFINSLVHAYDPILGKKQIAKIEIEDLRDRWAEKFVDSFSALGGKVKPSCVLNNGTSQKFKSYKLPYQLKDNVGLVESEMVNALTFYNLQVSFLNVGNTDRRSGTFIDIFSASDEPVKSDEKIIGRWFVTALRHRFFADLYTNEFLCCKTYVGPENNVKEDVE